MKNHKKTGKNLIVMGVLLMLFSVPNFFLASQKYKEAEIISHTNTIRAAVREDSAKFQRTIAIVLLAGGIVALVGGIIVKKNKNMALITCSQCGHEISDKANFCPHCGKKVEKKFFTKTRIAMGIISLVAIVAIILSVYSIYIHQSKSPAPVPDTSETSDSSDKDKSSKEEATTVKDIDGNVYKTVKIGNQVWMAENLRTTRYANGESIPLGTSTSTITPYRYNPNDNADNVCDYGYLYNWPAAMHGAQSSESNPSGVQGICPDGWHVPSDAEWTELTDYVGSQPQFQCDNSSDNIAKSLASTTGWNSSTNNCAVGNNPSTNNATGFSALPAGGYDDGLYNYFGNYAYFWSATEYNGYDAYYRYLYYYNAYVARGNYGKGNGFSVRCVRD